MAYGAFKNLPRRIASDKLSCDKVFSIAKNLKYEGYQRGLVTMVYKFFHKKTAGIGAKSEITQYHELAEELDKLIITKFEKRKVYSSFKDNIWGADLEDMQLISKFNIEF